MASLATTVNGIKFSNPFVIGSGPPGTNANVISKAFEQFSACLGSNSPGMTHKPLKKARVRNTPVQGIY